MSLNLVAIFVDMKFFIIISNSSFTIYRIYSNNPSLIHDIDNLCLPFFSLIRLGKGLSSY